MTTKTATREEICKIFGELTDKEVEAKQKAIDEAMRRFGIDKKPFLKRLTKYKKEGIEPVSPHLTVYFRNICK